MENAAPFDNAGKGLPDETGNNVDRKAEWQRVMRLLRAECGDNVYNSWFARLELDKLFGTVAICSVPTKFLKSWIESHFFKQLEASVKSEFPGITKVVLNVRSAVRVNKAQLSKPAEDSNSSMENGTRAGNNMPSTNEIARGMFFDASVPHGSNAKSNHEENLLGSSPLDRRLVFETFLVGPSNQLAHAAAQRIAADPSDARLPYNPLYIHAGVGMGKTHLLQSIAHQCLQNNRRVIYLTAEKFMYGFVSALKAQSAIAYKEWLRTIDLLIIDDLQFLQGKMLQHEFGHTLNSLIDAGRQIIVAALAAG